MASLPVIVAVLALGALALHFRARYPVRGALLVVSGRRRFGLPVDGRFDLGLRADTRLGAFWVELEFSDRPNSRFLVIRDQMSEPEWRQLCLNVREGL